MTPSAADADDIPGNGGPFWDGWTFRHPNVDGNLPGSDNFHPLRAEIEDGTIAPSPTNECSTISDTFLDGGQVSVFGIPFPVCVIPGGRYDSDAGTLTNDHVYLLEDTLNVGNGQNEEASEGGSLTVANDEMVIEAGTQLMGSDENNPAVVITRGSTIDARGTAEQPIILGAINDDPSATDRIQDDPTELGGRGQGWWYRAQRIR
ncbi:MAG: hypothetical protein U5K73_03480 [Halofilum sp. (in: g-proteobacteria)]|nr:hypothetical protein [Halofilum sp. (in: g-proteobacteria)]